jgi:hypothetical protein
MINLRDLDSTLSLFLQILVTKNAKMAFFMYKPLFDLAESCGTL